MTATDRYNLELMVAKNGTVTDLEYKGAERGMRKLIAAGYVVEQGANGRTRIFAITPAGRAQTA